MLQVPAGYQEKPGFKCGSCGSSGGREFPECVSTYFRQSPLTFTRELAA